MNEKHINKFETHKGPDGNLHVCIEVLHEYRPGSVPRIRIDAKDVASMLDERGIKHGKCITKDNTLYNWREHTRKVEWIFKISLDKKSKSVILKEEKSVQPKPKTTRKRRTRSSTKKGSTEE